MNGMPSTATALLHLMPSKASEVATFVKQVVTSVRNGDTNPLEVLVTLRAIEAAAEEIREEIQENIMSEVDKFSEKKFERYGAIVEKAELGTKYSYLQTGDLEYEELHADAATATRRLKEREEFLKTLKEPLTVANRHTGEMYEIRPPVKTSKSGVKIYIK